MTLIRKALADLKLEEALTNETIIRDALSYFGRQDDHAQIRSDIKQRYGSGKKIVKDPGDGTGVTETYVRAEFADMVDNNQVENFSIGFGQKIAGALATLFTENGQKYSLTHETIEDEKNLESVEKLLYEDNRAASTFDATMVDVDNTSILVGSAAVFVESSRGRLSYRKLTPADVTFHFNEYVEEEGETRAVDRTDPEDATAVVVKLGVDENNEWSYLAILGRSEIYPNGRYVQFKGPEILTNIPAPYSEDSNAIENEIDGEMANPLTWWGNQPEQADKDIPEYPIIIIHGGVTKSADAMPRYTSLYDTSIGFDIDASHIDGTIQRASTGTRVHIPGQQSEGKPLPPTLMGDIALNPMDDVKAVPHDSAAPQIAMEILERSMLHAASGYGVPDYMVVSQDHTLDASSGVALAVKAAPLIKMRDCRIKLNRPSIKKLFEVEKALIGLHADNANDADIKLLLECEQNWDPGKIKLPENKNDLTTRLVTAKEKGLIDEIEAIRIWHEMGSDEEAISFYLKMKGRQEDYPPLVKEEVKKPPLGLKGRTQATNL